MNRIFTRLGFTAAALVAGSGIVAYAQTSTTGSISGVVSAKDGAPLADVAITITSKQVSRTLKTGADGTFRAGLLNPGDWTIQVAKNGFVTQTAKITVLTNENKATTFKLVPPGAAVVEVIALEAAKVDMTQTTQGFNASMETLSSVPTGRSFNDLAILTPGVVSSDPGGLGGWSDPSISGASGAENSYVLDGLVTTDFRSGLQSAGLVTDFIDQVEVQTGGFKPEFSALGGVFNVTTKSGSNDFKGSAWATWDPRGLVSVPKKNDYARQAPPRTRYDVGAEVSGPILKDKLFYFVGIDGTFRESPQDQPNYTGSVGSERKLVDTQFVSKLNYYLTQDMQLVFFYNRNVSTDKQDFAAFQAGPGNNGFDNKTTTDNINLTFLWNIDSSTFLNTRLGYVNQKDENHPTDSSITINDRRYWTLNPDPAGVYNTGLDPYFRGGAGAVTDETAKTSQFALDVTKYLGNHALKAGVSWLSSKATDTSHGTGPVTPNNPYDYITNPTGDPASGLRPRLFRISASGSYAMGDYYNIDSKATTIQQAVFIQDTWEAIPGLRVAYGFRAESQEVKADDGTSIMKFNFKDGFSPRLGLVWDVSNDGRTKVAASYGRYFESIPTRLAIRGYGGANGETFYRVYYNLGAANYNPNAANGVGNIQYGSIRAAVDNSTPFSNDPVQDGIKLPQREEVTLGIDHTFASKWTFGVHGKHREMKNIIEDSSITDAAGNAIYNKAVAIQENTGQTYGFIGQSFAGAILWNPGPHGISFKTAPNSIDAHNGISRITVGSTLFPEARNIYDSVDFTFEKKSERAFISGSYTWSRLEGNYEGVVSSSNGQADGNITASFDDYNYIGWGKLPLNRQDVFKLFGSYKFDVGAGNLTIGANFSYMSGTPRTIFGGGTLPGYPDPLGYGNATPHNKTYGGDGTNPATLNTDVNVDYVQKIGRFQVAPFFNVFNLFNMRRPLGYQDILTNSSGDLRSDFGSETAWQAGRRWRFGLRVRF